MTKKNQDKFPVKNNDVLRSVNVSPTDEYLIVPVVVHVIHNNGPENISDALIISQIEVLNEDFGHYGTYNNDSRGKDSKIRFCLASYDPDGLPTTGIVRVQSPYTNLNSSDEMQTKSLSRWDPYKYLNIWIVKSIDGEETTQGYSYLPRDAQGPLFNGDGIVITYKYFGRNTSSSSYYNLGRTTSHEVGHYFDLLHPWGGDDFGAGEGGCNDDDGIDDTPLCSEDFYAYPPKCEHPTQCMNTRMIEDFMDYSTDKCMSLFTEGQSDHMRKSIFKYRSDLVSYENILAKGCSELYDSLNNNLFIQVYPNPVSPSKGKLFITSFSKYSFDMEVEIYDMFGRLVYYEKLEGLTKTTSEIDLTNFNSGLYFFIAKYEHRSYQQKIVIGYNQE